MRTNLFRGASPRRTPRHTRLLTLVRDTHLAVKRAVTTAALVAMAGGTSVLACPVCFGADETPMIDGAKVGVMVMLAITLAVQGAFVGFFLYLRKRAKRIADIELDHEWSELQRPSRTS
jgi:hypothetical protein